MSDLNNPFSASMITGATRGIMSSAMLLETYATGIVTQPTASIDSVPGFADDQVAVVKNALQVQSDLITGILGLTSNSLSFANQFNSQYAQLQSLAKVIDDASKSDQERQDAGKEFITGLNLLMKASAENSNQIDPSQIDVYSDLIQENAVALDADLKVAEEVLEEGTIADLKSQLNDVLAKLDADNKKISDGAVEGLVDAAEIALGVVLSYYKGPKEGFEMIVAGIKGAAEESSKEKEAIDDVNKQFGIYSDLMTQLLSDEAIYSVIKTVDIYTDLLESHIQAASVAVKTFDDAWNALIGGLSKLASEIEAGPDSALNLEFRLAQANKEWSALHDQIQSSQLAGPMPVSKEKVDTTANAA